MNNLVEMLEAKDDVALVGADGRRWTYAELRRRVGEVAGALVDLGLRPGDRVAVLLPVGVDLYVALLALWWVGATAVLVDPSAPLAHNLARARPVGFVGVPRAHLLRLTVPALQGLDLQVSTGFTPLPHRRLSSLRGEPPPVCAAPGPALVTFTSGTGGAPKALVRRHRVLLAQHEALRRHHDLRPGDLELATLPVFLLHALACGATAVVADGPLHRPAEVRPDRLAAQVRREGVTTATGSPTLLGRLARHLALRGEAIEGVRRVLLGGARVPAAVVADCCRAFPRAEILVVYGSTEAEPVAVLDAAAALDELRVAEEDGRGVLVGRPVPEVRLRVDDDEVLVAGPHVVTEYFGDPGAEALHVVREPLPGGGERRWLRTGDAGFLDEHGRLWLVGRVGERCGGLWPLPTEAAAERLPFVRRAGLVELDGRAVLACELAEDAPEDWALRVHRATGAHPVRVARVPLDRRHNAKVDRAALSALLAGR